MGNTYDPNILKAAGLKLDANGQLSETQDIAYQREANNQKIALANKISSAEAASARAAAVVSPEMEQANILWEKTKKYMPTMMKQAGLDGLGVSQTAMLRAQSDHNNLMGELARERNRAMSAAGGLTMDAYRAYVEQIEGENRALDLSEARIRARQIYENSGWSDEYKEEQFGNLLAGFDGNTEIQNALLEDVKVYREDAALLGDLERLFGAGEGSVPSVSDYEGAIDGDATADPWANVDVEKILAMYSAEDESGRKVINDYLAALGAMSVEDKAKEMETADGNVMKLLLSYGAGYDERGEFIFGDAPIDKLESLLNDGSLQMSKGLRQSIEDHVEISKGRRVTKDENYLKTRIESVDPKDLDAAGAKAYLEDLSEYLNDDNTPNLDRITQEFYDEHLKPELDSLKEWQDYLYEEEQNSKETYDKQMAGEKAIEVDGEKWYVANSPEGDVETFMKENEEAVNKALGEYGNVKNPSIPNNTVIKVGNVNLIYDKATRAWKYATELLPNDRFKYQAPSGEIHRATYYVVNGQEKEIREVKNEEVLKSINEVNLGDKAKNGKVLTIKMDGKAREFVLFNGKWYHTTYAQWYKFE